MLTIVQAETPEQIGQVRELISEYRAYLRAEVDNEMEESEVPTVAALEQELEELPGIYVPPRGCLLLAFVDGDAAGCIALLPYRPDAGEVKRLWVRPRARGRKAGRLLADTLIAQARAAGYRQLLLSTSIKMTDAQRLYRSLGFQTIEPYFDGPPAFMAQEVFMRLDL
ncbi:MAG: GNAT family N-acetyltransferase [Anaerolineae bacterium]|nr:GNAT family N-acetyltransferase [Anaerolineae bacterium]